jgi:putative restriction endonuclease
MRLFVGVTDYDWFQLRAGKLGVDEVNFWRPSPEAGFKALSPGELLLFKLHSPRNFIAGGGFRAQRRIEPRNLNGASSNGIAGATK